MQDKDFLDDLLEYEHYIMLTNILAVICHKFHIKTDELLGYKKTNIIKKQIIKQIIKTDTFNEIYEKGNQTYKPKKKIKRCLNKVNSKILIKN